MKYWVQGCQMSFICWAKSRIWNPVQREPTTQHLVGLHLVDRAPSATYSVVIPHSHPWCQPMHSPQKYRGWPGQQYPFLHLASSFIFLILARNVCQFLACCWVNGRGKEGIEAIEKYRVDTVQRHTKQNVAQIPLENCRDDLWVRRVDQKAPHCLYWDDY